MPPPTPPLSPHTWILPSTPVVSIRLATLTLLPQMSYWGFWAPITPAITGPWLIPDRREQVTPHPPRKGQENRPARTVLTDPQPEVVEGVLVDDVELPHQREGELHHGADVHVLSVVFLRDAQKRAPPEPPLLTLHLPKCGGREWIYCPNTG